MENNSRKCLSNFLGMVIANGKITKMALHKSTKIGRPSINSYLEETAAPTIDQLDRMADAMGFYSWELIKPEGAIPATQPKTPTEEDLLAMVKERDKHIRELEAKLSIDTLVEDKPVSVKRKDTDDRRWLKDFAATASDGDIESFMEIISEVRARRDKSKRRRTPSDTS